jgi:hypothetical protein
MNIFEVQFWSVVIFVISCLAIVAKLADYHLKKYGYAWFMNNKREEVKR